MRRLPPLAALRAFEAAARHLSFKRAAAELAVTPTAISHQIRSLEDQIGLRLFERGPRRLLLTAEGQRLYPVLRDGFDAFAKAIAGLTERRSRPAVTLSATRAFTARWLVPRTASFAAAHPGFDLRLHAADEPVELGRGAVDAAIRYGRGNFPGLKAEKLSSMSSRRWQVHASSCTSPRICASTLLSTLSGIGPTATRRSGPAGLSVRA